MGLFAMPKLDTAQKIALRDQLRTNYISAFTQRINTNAPGLTDSQKQWVLEQYSSRMPGSTTFGQKAGKLARAFFSPFMALGRDGGPWGVVASVGLLVVTGGMILIPAAIKGLWNMAQTVRSGFTAEYKPLDGRIRNEDRSQPNADLMDAWINGDEERLQVAIMLESQSIIQDISTTLERERENVKTAPANEITATANPNKSAPTKKQYVEAMDKVADAQKKVDKAVNGGKSEKIIDQAHAKLNEAQEKFEKIKEELGETQKVVNPYADAKPVEYKEPQPQPPTSPLPATPSSDKQGQDIAPARSTRSGRPG